jgi:hypothetical protein
MTAFEEEINPLDNYCPADFERAICIGSSGPCKSAKRVFALEDPGIRVLAR